MRYYFEISRIFRPDCYYRISVITWYDDYLLKLIRESTRTTHNSEFYDGFQFSFYLPLQAPTTIVQLTQSSMVRVATWSNTNNTQSWGERKGQRGIYFIVSPDHNNEWKRRFYFMICEDLSSLFKPFMVTLTLQFSISKLWPPTTLGISKYLSLIGW